MLSSGEVVLTNTGRQTTPFPAIKSGPRSSGKTLKNADQWLVQNAYDEAVSRGDNFNAIQFKQDIGRKNITQASKDSAEEYLFGDFIPPVIKGSLKKLEAQAKPAEVSGSPIQENEPQPDLTRMDEPQKQATVQIDQDSQGDKVVSARLSESKKDSLSMATPSHSASGIASHFSASLRSLHARQ